MSDFWDTLDVDQGLVLGTQISFEPTRTTNATSRRDDAVPSGRNDGAVRRRADSQETETEEVVEEGDIDWDEIIGVLVGSEGAVGEGGGATPNRKKRANSANSSANSSFSYHSKKLMRNDSLRRIIVGSQLLTTTGDPMLDAASDVLEASSIGKRARIASMSNEELVAGIFEFFNSGDLDTLSYALDYRFADDVVFTSTALKDHHTPPNLIKLKGKKYIMLMWGLETELFPDAVWIETSSETTTTTTSEGGVVGSGEGEVMVVKKTFKFDGTRVFHPSTMALYEYVCYHAAIVDPLLAQPFTDLGNGVITILVPGPDQAAQTTQTTQPPSSIPHSRVVELMVQAEAEKGFEAARLNLSTCDILALQSTEAGTPVYALDRQVAFYFGADGKVNRVESSGDP